MKENVQELLFWPSAIYGPWVQFIGLRVQAF
jgi:hypothetical protein